MFARILVGYDGSFEAQAALRLALELARHDDGARVTAVAVAHLPRAPATVGEVHEERQSRKRGAGSGLPPPSPTPTTATSASTPRRYWAARHPPSYGRPSNRRPIYSSSAPPGAGCPGHAYAGAARPRSLAPRRALSSSPTDDPLP